MQGEREGSVLFTYEVRKHQHRTDDGQRRRGSRVIGERGNGADHHCAGTEKTDAAAVCRTVGLFSCLYGDVSKTGKSALAAFLGKVGRIFGARLKRCSRHVEAMFMPYGECSSKPPYGQFEESIYRQMSHCRGRIVLSKYANAVF